MSRSIIQLYKENEIIRHSLRMIISSYKSMLKCTDNISDKAMTYMILTGKLAMFVELCSCLLQGCIVDIEEFYELHRIRSAIDMQAFRAMYK